MGPSLPRLGQGVLTGRNFRSRCAKRLCQTFRCAARPHADPGHGIRCVCARAVLCDTVRLLRLQHLYGRRTQGAGSDAWLQALRAELDMAAAALGSVPADTVFVGGEPLPARGAAPGRGPRRGPRQLRPGARRRGHHRGQPGVHRPGVLRRCAPPATPGSPWACSPPPRGFSPCWTARTRRVGRWRRPAKHSPPGSSTSTST